MSVGKLTRSRVDAAQASGTDMVIWDSELRGFGLKLTKGGSKVYIVQYRMGGRGAPTRRYTIGGHGSPWTAIAARREAERILVAAKSGRDLQAAAVEKHRRDIDLAFDAYVEKFLSEYGKSNWKPRTYLSAASNLRRWGVGTLGRKSLEEIERRHLTAVFDKIPVSSPALKRSLFAHMRKLFAWAVERDDIKKSPFMGMKCPPAVKSRVRTLDDDELSRVLAASMSMPHPFGPFVRLLLLTGQRRDEVAGMRWEELHKNSAEWWLPEGRTKNSRSHIVPLSDVVFSEINDLTKGGEWPSSGFVLSTTGTTAISGFSKMKGRLDQRIATLRPSRAIAGWRLHDLRRSMATSFQRLGIRFEVTEAMLNHISGSKSGVAGVYQRHDWSAEKHVAAQTWANHLRKLVADGAHAQRS